MNLYNVYIGLGSNLGDRKLNLMEAIKSLQTTHCLQILQVSSFYKNPAWGVINQPWFLNAALSGETHYTPFQLLKFVKDLEIFLGRVKSYQWGPRLIDIDILLYGNEQINSYELTIPHPGITQRPFVLGPLLEISPDLRDLISGKLYQSFLKDLTLRGLNQLELYSPPPAI